MNNSAMKSIPKNLYRPDQVQQLDRLIIEQYNIPGMSLMERAGSAAFALIRKRWPRAQRIAILCGAGNNGGDGFVIARLAAAEGMRVVIYQVGDHTALSGDALTAFERLEGSHVDIHPFDEGHALDVFDVIVDCMLGTGLKGDVKGIWRSAIEAINTTINSITHARPQVLAVDVPSGLDANTGHVLGAAVRAEACISFIGMKQGLLTGDGPEYCGEISFDDLQSPADVYQQLEPASRRIELEEYRRYFSPRSKSAHKGQFGHVLVVGGNHGMSGAARMAAEAALRTGAGIVSVATRLQHAHVLNQGRPELMCHGVEDPHALAPLLAKADVVAIGPGLGQDDWAQAMLAKVLDANLPMVADADALTLLAKDPRTVDNWVLTPHPGEAARLLRVSAEEVQNDRFSAALKIQKQYKGVCVLKGAGTIITSDSVSPAVCDAGNPGMASAGMGDVLSGVIASLMAQSSTGDLPVSEAAAAGVCLHAAAADRAAANGERGLLASDLFPHIRALVNLA